MARARNIKPAIMDNEDLASLPPLTRLLFIYLWMLADKAGRLEDRPNRIKKQAIGYDQGDAEAMLEELDRAGFIQRYAVDGNRLIQIKTFSKHQTPHVREQESTLPGPEQSTAKVVTKHSQGSDEPSPRSPDSGFSDSRIPDSGLLDTGLGADAQRGSGKPKSAPQGYSEGFEAFWEAWPRSDRKVEKKGCAKLWHKAGLELRTEEIVAKVKAWAKTDQWRKDGGKFIPMPATWLQGRYDDDMPPDTQEVAKQLIAEKWAKAGAKNLGYIDMEAA